MKHRNPVWTEDEIYYLVQNKNNLKIKEIAAFLNRSEKAVRRKLDKLGFNLGKINYWSDTEEATLIDNKDESLSKLMELLPNRSEMAIKVKLSCLHRNEESNRV